LNRTILYSVRLLAAHSNHHQRALVISKLQVFPTSSTQLDVITIELSLLIPEAYAHLSLTSKECSQEESQASTSLEKTDYRCSASIKISRFYTLKTIVFQSRGADAEKPRDQCISHLLRNYSRRRRFCTATVSIRIEGTVYIGTSSIPT
jgi:hypothetical protein